MTNMTADGAPGAADRFDAIETTLARYPHLDEAELRDLKYWFRREASALEVASLASKDAIADQYRAFRAQYVDNFDAGDVLKGIAGASLIAAVIGGIYLMA
ncbi:MAG: hypothetical protein ACTHKM_12475 [Tsuneonella sp.]